MAREEKALPEERQAEPQVEEDHYFTQTYDDEVRFLSYFVQIDLVRRLRPRSILEVGPGTHTAADYLRRAGTAVTTVDLDPGLLPDCLADLRCLPFPDGAFELVMACQVLEHLPFTEFAPALDELGRVAARQMVVSLPHPSAPLEVVLRFPQIERLLGRKFLRLFWRVPRLTSRHRFDGEHYWVMGKPGFPARRIRGIIRERGFRILEERTPVLDHYRHFFVLERENPHGP